MQHPAPPADPVDRSTDVQILAFYATAAEIREGDDELVCYSVRNARTVRMDPPAEGLRPSLSRCFRIEPRQDSRYTMIAEGFDGREVSASFSIRVKPPLPWIAFFAVSHKVIRRGDAVTLCYGVEHAHAVELQPVGWKLDPVPKNCARFYPKVTRRYALVAFGAEGRTDRQRFTVGVQ